MKAWQIGVGFAIALGVGTAVFLGTRKASAAAAGAKAFRVDADCRKVETLDLDAAKAAVQAAAMAEFRGQDEKAIDFAYRVVSLVIGCRPSNLTMFVGLPGTVGGISWESVKSQIGDRTVAELAQLAASGGVQMAVQPGYEGTASSNLADIGKWLLPASWYKTLLALATQVPIPFVPPGYKPPKGEMWFTWGHSVFRVSKTSDGKWTVARYKDRNPYSGDFEPLNAENMALLHFNEYKFDGSMHSGDALWAGMLAFSDELAEVM